MRHLICAIGVLLVAHSQVMSQGQPVGIQFVHGLSWKEIQAKARTENKYIFVDCFATWCGPCKQMDKEIYTQDTVGNYFNNKFISIKLQMDSSKEDKEDIKNWYADARAMMQRYKITAFPTFLFFSRDGELVHLAVGYKEISDFLSLGSDAFNPNKQNYALMEQYKMGVKNYTSMAYLATNALSMNDNEMAWKIAKDYTDHYLLHLNERGLYMPDNLSFMRNFTQSSRDSGFVFLYKHAEKIDKTMKDPMYVEGFVDYIIAKEEIDAKLWPEGESPVTAPEWENIRAEITKKYNSTYADRTITGAKVRWYGWKQDWQEFTKNKVALVEKYGTYMSNEELNANSWDVFLHSKDKKEISIAITWVKRVLETQPEWSNAWDTYANLVYKLGKNTDWIAIEEKAIQLAPGDKDIRDNYAKMKNGEATWISN